MKTILVVDDKPSIRNLLARKLEASGLNVITAEDGEQALVKFRENDVDLIILDIIMPNKEGLEVIMELRQDYPDLPIFAMSGGSGNIYSGYCVDIAAKFGATKTFSKPFSLSDMSDAVLEELRKIDEKDDED